MMDVAQKRGLVIDTARLQAELGIPIIETVAVKLGGGAALIAQLDAMTTQTQGRVVQAAWRSSMPIILRPWKPRSVRFAAFWMQ